METRNQNYVQMANQESNINQSGAKMSLLKTFKSKVLPNKSEVLLKSRFLFLSSIVTLSILSLANSTFAFPAKVNVNQNRYLTFYWAPHQHNNPQEDKKTYRINEIKNVQLVHNTLIDVLYCRNDKWCYISGYYSQGTREQPVGYIPRKAWADSTELCDAENDNYTNPLPPCSNNGSNYDGIQKSANSFKTFFCNSDQDNEGHPVPNPWQWLFDGTTNSNFCNPNSP